MNDPKNVQIPITLPGVRANPSADDYATFKKTPSVRLKDETG